MFLDNLAKFANDRLFKPLSAKLDAVGQHALASDTELATLKAENARLKSLYTDSRVATTPPAAVAGARKPFQLENPVKDKLKAGEPVYGGFVASSDPMSTEIFGEAGLDYVFIDAEHTTMGPQEVANHIRAARAEGTVPIVRVPLNGVENIKKYIDAGPLGVIVPNIRTAQDAMDAVEAVKYAPEGGRHVGLGAASGYSAHLGPYLEQANDHVMLGLMGEHADMATNIDAILDAVHGQVDFITVGPQDMAASLGLRGQPGDPKVAAAFKEIEAGAARHHVPMGASVKDRDQAASMMKDGYRFFTGPSDFEPLINAARAFAQPPAAVAKVA